MVSIAAFDLVGWSTVALAVVTASSVLLGYRVLRQTQAEIALSRREVEEAHRPVLVPNTHSVHYYHGTGRIPKGTETVGAAAVGTDGIHLMLDNIGSGPALRIETRIQLRGDDGGLTTGNGTFWWTQEITGIGAGDSSSISVPVDRLADLPCFQLELRYGDLAGNVWITRGLYMSKRATGVVATFNDLEVKRAKRTGMPPSER